MKTVLYLDLNDSFYLHKDSNLNFLPPNLERKKSAVFVALCILGLARFCPSFILEVAQLRQTLANCRNKSKMVTVWP